MNITTRLKKSFFSPALFSVLSIITILFFGWYFIGEYIIAPHIDGNFIVIDKNVLANSIRTALIVQMGLLSVVGIGTAILFFKVYEYNVKNPLEKVTNYSKRLLKHDYTSPVEVDHSSSFAELTNSLKYISIDMQSIFGRFEEAVIELEEKKEEQQDTLSYLRAILENMADGLLVTDASSKIILANKTLLNIFNCREEEIKGKAVEQVFVSDMANLVQTCVEKDGRETSSLELALTDKRIIKAIATPIIQHNHKNVVVTGVVIILRDITQEKEVDRIKTEFISTVSHELRTPLTSVLGFARIIKKRLEESIIPLIQVDNKKTDRYIKQVQENLEIIIVEGERLTTMINDVLDIAKMEAGKTEWKKEPVNIKKIIEQATAATASLFEQKNLSLQVDIAEGIMELSGDKDRIIQVIINLISNAVKFTEQGSIACRARADHEQAIVSVIDTGIGIAKEDQEKVFEKFKQVGNYLTDKPNGTGLGLSICQQIVEYHGGRIWLESELGKGSNFSFSLPFSSKDTCSQGVSEIRGVLLKRENEQGVSLNNKDKKLIMLADDDASLRKLLRHELENAGYSVCEVDNGLSTIKQVKQVKPDLILLDIILPDMNGFDVAAVIKNDPETINIPIMVVSVTEDKERGYRIGIDKYLTKPFHSEELVKEIKMLLLKNKLIASNEVN